MFFCPDSPGYILDQIHALMDKPTNIRNMKVIAQRSVAFSLVFSPSSASKSVLSTMSKSVVFSVMSSPSSVSLGDSEKTVCFSHILLSVQKSCRLHATAMREKN